MGQFHGSKAREGRNRPSSQDSRSAASLDDSPCSTPPLGNTHFFVPSSRSFRELVSRNEGFEDEEGEGTSSRATATARGDAIRVWCGSVRSSRGRETLSEERE